MKGHSPGSAHILFLRVQRARARAELPRALGVPTFNVSIHFTRFERMLGTTIDSLAVPSVNVSIVFYMF